MTRDEAERRRWGFFLSLLGELPSGAIGAHDLVIPFDPILEARAVPLREAPVTRPACQVGMDFFRRQVRDHPEGWTESGRSVSCPVDLSLVDRGPVSEDCDRAAVESEEGRQLAAEE